MENLFKSLSHVIKRFTDYYDKVDSGNASFIERFLLKAATWIIVGSILIYWAASSNPASDRYAREAIDECKKDLSSLQSLRSNAYVGPSKTMPGFVKTEVPEGKVGACGANALTALKTYFYYRDEVSNREKVLTSLGGYPADDPVLVSQKEGLAEFLAAYNSEIRKLQNQVKQ